MKARENSARIMTVIGGSGVFIGGLDPLEGSIAIAAGSVMLAVAARMDNGERRVRFARYALCAAVLFGAGALWTLSLRGGVGGDTGRPMGWLVLVLPMLAGWALSFLAPGAPRWLTWMGVMGGAWYLVLPALVAWKARTNPQISWPLLAGLSGLGAATIAGCSWRLWRTRQPDLRR
jgi:hypothetical protein